MQGNSASRSGVLQWVVVLVVGVLVVTVVLGLHLIPRLNAGQKVLNAANPAFATPRLVDGATRFDGTPIKTVPDVPTYFGSDVIPVLETQTGNYHKLVATSTIDFIGPLVLAGGIIVIIYGLLMLLARRREPATREATRLAPAAAPG